MGRGRSRAHERRHDRIGKPGHLHDAGGRGRPPRVRGIAIGALALTGAALSVTGPAHALTLGEIALDSRLGEPLSARVPVRLEDGELLAAACVSVPAGVAPDLAQVPSPVVGVPEATGPGNWELRVSTTRPLYEPMYELQLQVRCPGTALLVRQYILMLDLPVATPPAGTATIVSIPATLPAPAPAATPERAAAPAPVPAATPARPSAPPLAATRTPIEGGTVYRVSEGDTLLAIARRARGDGSESLWARAERIFAANPDAFIGGDRDLIKLGSEIVIPAGMADAAAPAVGPSPRSAATAETPAMAPAAPAALAPAAPAVLPPVDAATLDEALPPAVVPATEEALAASEAAAPPAADTAVFQDEQPAAVTEAAPSTEAEYEAEAVAEARPADDSGAPWLEALVGLLVGGVLSIALLRKQLVEGLRGLRPGPADSRSVVTGFGAPAPAPAVRRVAAQESTMVVVEGVLDDDTDELSAPKLPRVQEQAFAPAQAAFSGGDPASDLSRLFGEDAHDSDATAYGLPPADQSALDLDLSAATPDTTIDQEIGWIGDEESLEPTQQAAALDPETSQTVEHIDLQALGSAATSDQRVSQTLEEALQLLESDYEDELTASRVIDRKTLENLPDAPEDEDFLVRTGTDQVPRPRR